jgi:hypothetical protein
MMTPAKMSEVGQKEEMDYLLYQLWMMVKSGKGWEGSGPAAGAATDELADPNGLLNLLLDLDDHAVLALRRCLVQLSDLSRLDLSTPVSVPVLAESLSKVGKVLRAANITGVNIEDGPKPGLFMLEIMPTPHNLAGLRLLDELIGPPAQKGGWHNSPPPQAPDRGRRMPPPRPRPIPPPPSSPPKKSTLLP